MLRPHRRLERHEEISERVRLVVAVRALVVELDAVAAALEQRRAGGGDEAALEGGGGGAVEQGLAVAVVGDDGLELDAASVRLRSSAPSPPPLASGVVQLTEPSASIPTAPSMTMCV